MNSSAGCPFSGLAICLPCLDFKTGFAGRVGECLHPPVELEPGAIECHLVDARRLAALGDHPTDRLGGRDHLRTGSVGHLCVDVLWRAVYGEARDTEIANVRTGPYRTAQPPLLLG